MNLVSLILIIASVLNTEILASYSGSSFGGGDEAGTWTDGDKFSNADSLEEEWRSRARDVARMRKPPGDLVRDLLNMVAIQSRVALNPVGVGNFARAARGIADNLHHWVSEVADNFQMAHKRMREEAARHNCQLSRVQVDPLSVLRLRSIKDSVHSRTTLQRRICDSEGSVYLNVDKSGDEKTQFVASMGLVKHGLQAIMQPEFPSI